MASQRYRARETSTAAYKMNKVHAEGEQKNEGYGEESWLQKLQIDEVLAAVGGASLEERDTDAGVSGSERGDRDSGDAR